MITITKAQRASLFKVYRRLVMESGEYRPYRQWRKEVPQHSYDCVMVPFCGMWLGIELDGYTHS